MQRIILSIVLVALSGRVGATIINVPADQSTIQAGIDVAVSGDTVLVASGTYPENLTVGKEIILLSVSGASLTIVDGTGGTSGITFTNNVSNNCLTKGFTFTNSTYGCDLTSGQPLIEECVFVGNASFPLYNAHPQEVGLYGANNTFIANINGSFNALSIRKGIVSNSTLWPLLPTGFVYYVTGTKRRIQVEGINTPELLISEGSIVKMTPRSGNFGCYFEVGVGNPGILTAKGVYFTAATDDALGGDSNGDGSASTPFPGYWSSIYLGSSSTGSILDSCFITYGGSNHNYSPTASAVYIDGSSPTITRCEFSNNLTNIRSEGGNPIISKNDISNTGADGYGMWLDIPIVNHNVSGNSITNGSYYPAQLDPMAVEQFILNNSFSLNSSGQYNGIEIETGIISDSTLWPLLPTGFVYYVTGTKRRIQVEGINTPELLISEGSIVKMTPRSGNFGCYFEVGVGNPGILTAKGVYFTAATDDALGGDSNGDGSASTPFPGYWSSIYLGSSSTGSILDSCFITYGGSNHNYSPTASAVYIDGSSPTITRCEFSNNLTAIRTVNSLPTLEYNSFVGNTVMGVQNSTASLMVDVTKNWWGDISGPLDASTGLPDYNPAGLGDSVSDYVDYRPWSMSANNPVLAILTPQDSSEVEPADSISIYVTAYDSLGIDSVRTSIIYGGVSEVYIDTIAPYTLPWQVPDTLSVQSKINILVESFTPDYRMSSASVSIFIAGSQPPILLAQPDSMGTNLGTQVLLELSVKNNGTRSGQFEYGISGLPLSWLSHESGSRYLQAGETAIDSFVLTIPATLEALADTGIYNINYYGLSSSGDSSFEQSVVYVSPFVSITNRRPLDGDGVIGNITRLTFETSGPAACSVFVMRASGDSSSLQAFVTPSGYDHEIVLDSLIRDSSYLWSIAAIADWGWATNGTDFQFTVMNGIVFVDDTLHLTVGRGYDQPFAVAALNNDSLPYHVQADVMNIPNDLIVGFTGPGSPDGEYYSYGPEGFNLDLRVHTQDVMPGDYRFDLSMTSWRDDSATVYLPVELTVTAPSLSIDAQVIAIDSLTLGHMIRIINLGDTVTNLTVTLPDSLQDKVYILPQIDHFLLGTGDSIFCEVIPYLILNEMNARGLEYNDRGFVQQFPSEFLQNQSGDFEVHYDGGLARIPLDFTPPVNKQVWLGTAENVRYCVEMRSWYCTNRPIINVVLNLPSGIDPAIVTDGMLSVSFEPRSSNVADHNVYMQFNDTPIGELLDGVPHGTYSFLVASENITFAGEGNASNQVQIETHWNTGGHYVVTEQFFFCLCLDRYSQYVVATTQAQADSIVNALPQLRHGLENLTVADIFPLAGDSVAIGSQVLIQASSFENDTVHTEIAVMAEFNNGESMINLYDDGWHGDLLPNDGVYGNYWQPINVGSVDITVRAGICGTYESIVIPGIEVVYPKIKAVAPVVSGLPQVLERARVELFRDNKWYRIDGTTDSTGEIELITMKNDSGETLPAIIAEGESIRVTFEVDTTQSYKWPGSIRSTTPVRRITIDSDSITSESGRLHVTRTSDRIQTVPLEHTLVRFSLVVATQWDIGGVDDSVIAKYKAGLRKASNYLYDITDGQALLDTIYFTDSPRFHKDSCDVRIYASHILGGGSPKVDVDELYQCKYNGAGAYKNVFFSHLDSLAFNNYGLPESSDDTLHLSVFMPRTWFYDSKRTRKRLMAKLPDWSEEKEYRVIFMDAWCRPFMGFTHELGHYLFGFYDEYQCGEKDQNGDPVIFRCPHANSLSALEDLGLMMMGEPLVSEMSTDITYFENTQYQNTLQYLAPGNRSCWGEFNDTYELRSDSSLGSARLHITSPADRGSELAGPNEWDYGTDAPVNVGAEMYFDTLQFNTHLNTHRGNNPGYVLLHIKECKNWWPDSDAGGASVKVKYASETDYFSQGDADDNGRIMLLGVHAGDQIQILSGDVPYVTEIPVTAIDDHEWNLTIPCDLNEVEGHIVAELGNEGNIEIVISDLIGSIGSQGNWYSICTGLSDVVDVLAEPSQNRIVVPLDSILCGTVVIDGTDTSGSTREYFIDYSRHQYDSDSGWTYSYIRDGKSRVDLDASYGPGGEIELVASGFKYGNWPSGMGPISRSLWVGFGGMSIPLTGNNTLRIEFNSLPDYSGYYDRFTICKLDTVTSEWLQVSTLVDSIALFATTVISEPGNYQLFIPAQCCQNRGNIDSIIGTGGPIDVSDLTYLIAYLFQGGPPPPCEEVGNVDGIVGTGGPIDVSDLTYLVAYLFQGGSPPPAC